MLEGLYCGKEVTKGTPLLQLKLTSGKFISRYMNLEAAVKIEKVK